MISLLNSISSLVAENAVSNTQSALQSTLQQLSTGLKINSGADDPAGLSIADGLGANISALTQSSQNSTNGIGLLQTADGALSQVNTILNQAVTIATEAANGGLTGSQSAALNTEYQSILTEIGNIGSTTNFNGQSVFAGDVNQLTSSQGSLATTTALTTGDKTSITDSLTGGTFVFTASAGNTIATLQTAITTAVTNGQLSAGTALTISGGKAVISTSTANDNLSVSTNDAVLGGFTATGGSGGTSSVYTGDGTSTGAGTLTTEIGALSASALSLGSTNLSSASSAQSALTAITNAIATVAANRGTIGASVNALTSDSNVETTQVQNLTSAQNNVQNADIATVTSHMTQYNVLEQTGFAALAQNNSAEQSVLKLLQ
jgi:flagellin